jgi:hypothetical protein
VLTFNERHMSTIQLLEATPVDWERAPRALPLTGQRNTGGNIIVTLVLGGLITSTIWPA